MRKHLTEFRDGVMTNARCRSNRRSKAVEIRRPHRRLSSTIARRDPLADISALRQLATASSLRRRSPSAADSIKSMKMMDRPVAVADTKPIGRGDRGTDPGLGMTDRGCQVLALGKACRNGRRQRAAGAVGIFGRKAWRRQRDGAVPRRSDNRRFRCPAPWPPLISTARHPIASRRWPWRAIAASLCATGSSSNAAASGRFGVISEARGTSFVRSASTASGASSRSPDVATITGSSTTCRGDHRVSPAAMASIVANCATIPILTASTVEIAEHGVDLRGHERRRHRMNAADARRVLGGQGGDDGCAIDAERRKRLQVGLDAGAARRIGAGDGERDRHRHRSARR